MDNIPVPGENVRPHRDRLAGIILGTAVGDSLGLVREGLSKRRGIRMYGLEVRHRFLLGRGMISDDTEHTCMTAQALLKSAGSPKTFASSLAWRLRWWLAVIPAGIGFGTLRAILKLWIGFGPGKSGVKSAGNGPAMRSAIIGGCFSGDTQRMKELVRASTRLTHIDPRAEQGTLAVALGAAYASKRATKDVNGPGVLKYLKEHVEDDELLKLLDKVNDALARGDSPESLAESLGQARGVSGFIYHTVPVCLFCWLRAPVDFVQAVSSVILLGGDTDTAGAITGALAGATAGASGIPSGLIDGIAEWPRSTRWMSRLVGSLSVLFPEKGQGASPGPVPLFWPAIPFRNLLFIVTILMHGFRRLLPPY